MIKGESSYVPKNFSYSSRYELNALEEDEKLVHEYNEFKLLLYILKPSCNKLLTLSIYDSTSNTYSIFALYVSSTFFTSYCLSIGSIIVAITYK